MYQRTLALMHTQMRNDFTALHVSGALWGAALLLAVIEASLTFTRGHLRGARDHLEGAEAILKARHGMTCSCDDYFTCSRWRRLTTKDPVVALVSRLLKERGIMQSLSSILDAVLVDEQGAVPVPAQSAQSFKTLDILLRR